MPFESCFFFEKNPKVRFFLTATFFLLAQKEGKNALRGENTDSTSRIRRKSGERL